MERAQYNQLTKEVKALLGIMDDRVNAIDSISVALQDRIYNMILDEMYKVNTQAGKIVFDTEFKRRILIIESKIYDILGSKKYTKEVEDLLAAFIIIEEQNKQLQKQYNGIDVKINEVRPARILLQETTEDALKKSLAPAYIEPAKSLLMQWGSANIGLRDAVEYLEQWNDGEMVKGKYTNTGEPTPNLQKYATQVARDGIYGVHRSFNNTVKETYGLDSFIYVGGLVADSRPICEYLVSLNRPISFDEVGELLVGRIPDEAMLFAEKPTVAGFLQGVVPNTNKDNFCRYCGGYNCTHQVVAVR